MTSPPRRSPAGVTRPPHIDPRCVNVFQADSEKRGMEERAEAERTASPVQTTAFFGVKKGFPGTAVDAGFLIQYSNFPLGRALSLSWIEHLTTNCGGHPCIPPSFQRFRPVRSSVISTGSDRIGQEVTAERKPRANGFPLLLSDDFFRSMLIQHVFGLLKWLK